MKNDVFISKEYLIYVVNEQTKVDGVKHVMHYHEDFGDLYILDHEECDGGSHYVWRIKSWDAMFITIKNSLRRIMREGICSVGDIKIVTDFKKKEA